MRALLLLPALLALPFLSCGESCPFGALRETPLEGRLGCCGASTTFDFPVGAPDSEFDVSNVEFPGQPPVDAYLTPATSNCDRLFTGAYPPAAGVQPSCPLLLGPVAPGTLSRRIAYDGTGSLRIHLYGRSSATTDAPYRVVVVRWGRDCNQPLP
jgi:hypothetical protein